QRSFLGDPELWHNLIDCFHIINIAKAGNSDESTRLRLFEEKIDLGSSQTGVDCHKHGSDLRQSELQDDPFGNIWCPQRDPIPRFYPQTEQAFGNLARKPFELAEIVSQCPIGIDQRFVLRIISSQQSEQFTYCDVSICARCIQSFATRHVASSRTSAAIQDTGYPSLTSS